MTNLMTLAGLPKTTFKNKENQFIDFRLITTKDENHAFSSFVIKLRQGLRPA
ncbi:hypothetical protein [Serratia marcescens]|uniref:hypothetical protein n=1 Tax=Serratia marcescens TaxID=615 RepID=UPI0012AFFD00|nr:hypothetical protein [Serratia marcescens]